MIVMKEFVSQKMVGMETEKKPFSVTIATVTMTKNASSK